MGGLRDIFGVISAALGQRRRERWTPEKIREWQNRRTLELARFAKERSPFYRRLYAGIDLSGPVRLSDLPVVDKVAIMEHFDEVVTDSTLHLSELQERLGRPDVGTPFGKDYRLLSTAGTSGLRGLFVLGRNEWTRVMAAMLRWQRYTGLRPRPGHRLRVATVGAGNSLHASHLLPLGTDVGLYSFRFLSVTTPMEQLVAELNEFRPDLLAPYASVAGLLAIEQEQGRLSIQPKIVVTHSELLTEPIARRVEETWGTRPFNHYGLSEMPCVGVDCEWHRGIHAFEDLCLIEPVDALGHPVPPGEVCEKYYLTNFLYQLQPLIRYEISDRIALSPPGCPCGSPFSLIRTMEGRNEDSVTMHRPDGSEVRIPPLAFTLAVEDLPGVVEHEFSFREGLAPIEVRIRPAPEVSPNELEQTIQSAIARLLDGFGVVPAEVRVHFASRFDRDPEKMGKHKILRKERPEGSG
ncbi:MAG: phenylacetate--CoA ligase family protein [Verrucomicrobiae bacterium]|nr:phenylacetate--CoA ligase family protein [Verrucomicrobiae bacterium]